MKPPRDPVVRDDEGTEALDRLLTNDVLGRADRFAWEELSPLLDATVKAQLGSETAECEGEVASTLLRECGKRMADELRKWAEGYSALRWRWMLRRIPRRVFAGDYSTTHGYDSALAEVIAGASKTENPRALRESNGQVFYYLDGTTPTRLARFCGGVRLLSNFHQWYRWAGKGARFSFERGRPPRPSIDPRIRFAVETYDRRVERSGRPLHGLGSIVTSRDDLGTLDGILWVDRISPTEMPCPPPGVRLVDDPPLSEWDRTTASFLVGRIDLGKLQKLISDARVDLASVVSREAASLLYLLACGTSLLVHHLSGLYGLMRVGYLVWMEESDAFEELTKVPTGSPFVNELLTINSITTREEAVAVLQGLTGRDWPLLAGPVWLRDSRAICVDFYAATIMLNAALQFPAEGGGASANARAEHFEVEVQTIIDANGWKPTSATCPQPQTVLRREGRDITDIDAVGERAGTLILVSCKSIPYSAEYDAGEYRTVRNAASTVEKAVEWWHGRLTKLRENPKGDNYDLSGFDQLVGVVCTPHVIFVFPDTLDQWAAPGLRMASSVSELADWLKATPILAPLPS